MNEQDVDPAKGYIGADGEYYDWYDLNGYLLSRNAAISFDIGARGIGKTTSWANWAMATWRRYGAQWAILVRREDELSIARANFWGGIAGRGYETMSQGMQCFARERRPVDVKAADWKAEHPWRPFGWWLCMKNANMYKQASARFSNVPVDKMLFDEFIVEDNAKRYLETEPSPLMSIASSVFRNRPRRVQCFSNAGFVNNPYFRAYGVTSGDFDHGDMEHGAYVRRAGGDVLFHYTRQPSPKVYTQGLLKSEKDYQVRNLFRDVTGTGVAAPPKVRRLIYCLTDGPHVYRVYDILVNDWLYIEEGQAADSVPLYNLDPYLITRHGIYDQRIMKRLKQVQHLGKLRFRTDEARNAIFDVI